VHYQYKTPQSPIRPTYRWNSRKNSKDKFKISLVEKMDSELDIDEGEMGVEEWLQQICPLE
jgi:hypothetical protein